MMKINLLLTFDYELPLGGCESYDKGLFDPAGREVKELFEGVLQVGESKFFFYAGDYAAGTYTLVLDTEYGRLSQKILILE